MPMTHMVTAPSRALLQIIPLLMQIPFVIEVIITTRRRSSTILASYWHSSNSNDGWSFSSNSFGDILSVEEAFEKIKGLKNTSRFSALDYKFKQIAVAFYLWYKMKTDEDHHVLRSEVDSEIPNWECFDK